MKQHCPLSLLLVLALLFPSNAITAAKAASGVIPSAKVSVVPKVIYGNDDRIEVYQETNLQRVKFAASTCGLFDSARMIQNTDGSFALKLAPFQVGGEPACGGEPFGNQAKGAYCSGFLVGPDLVATAGHCITGTGDLLSTYFVFGFQMQAQNIEVMNVGADQVYTGVQLLGQAQLTSGSQTLDYSVVRLDRAVTAFGASPLNIRRAGTIPLNTGVGVIGHPSGLPMKIAFGSATQVYANTNGGFFVANTDTYGGNSGSPIFNQSNGVLEGILVRGEADYSFDSTNNCFFSQRIPDASAGEEISKTTTFASLIPGRTTPYFNQIAYKDSQTIILSLTDSNAPGVNVTVNVTTTRGDTESVTLSDSDGDRVFSGSLSIGNSAGTLTVGNGTLEGNATDTITATYSDAQNETATGPQVVSSTAPLNNVAPGFLNLQATNLHPDSVMVQFRTTQRASCRVQYGDNPSNPSDEVLTFDDATGTSHTALISGVSACSSVYYRLLATGTSGVSAMANNGGLGYFMHFTGTPALSYDFDAVTLGWTHAASLGTDSWDVRTYINNPSGIKVYSYQPASSSTADSTLVSPALGAPSQLDFFQQFTFDQSSSLYHDGGLLEYTTTGGASWLDAGSRILEGGYNGTLAVDNPLAGRSAWTGNTRGRFIHCRVDLTGLTNVQVRFRFVANSSVSSADWAIDSVNAGTFSACPNGASGWQIYE